MLPVHAIEVKISEFINVMCKEWFGAKEAPCPVKTACSIQQLITFVADGDPVTLLPEFFYLLKHLFGMVVDIDNQVIKSCPDNSLRRKFQHGPAIDVSQRLGYGTGHLPQPGAKAGCKDHCLHSSRAVCFTDTSTPGIAESIRATLSALQTER